MDRKLNIGGTAPAPGWEIFNILPGPTVDHVGNALDLSRFADGTFAEIYASHVVEHFDYKLELVSALREWHRVLRPGGVLRISVPDLEILAVLLLQRDKLDLQARFHVMRMIFGGHVDAHDYHVVGLTDDILAAFLSDAGFPAVQRVDRHGLFADTSDMVFRGVPISLNVLATKPALMS
jgi:predicted SAM-dependent methyltransferase